MWTALVRDLRYAARISWRDLGFTIVAATTLGLAIGTTSGVFGLIDALITRPLPVGAPEELVVVLSPSAGGGGLSYRDYQDYRSEPEALTDLAAYTWTTVGLEATGSTREVEAFLVSENYFSVLRIGAAQGRTFLEHPGGGTAAPEIVLSHAFWQASFDGDPGALGRVVRIKGEPFTIVGVAPPGFTGTLRGYLPDLWVPLTTQQTRESLENRAARGLLGLGRLRPGVSVAAAQNRMALVAKRLAATLSRDQPRRVDPRFPRVDGVPPRRAAGDSAEAGLLRPLRPRPGHRLREPREPSPGPRHVPPERRSRSGLRWERAGRTSFVSC